MFWFDRLSIQHHIEGAREESNSCAREVFAILSSRRMLKTAGASKDIVFHVDPKLASKYKINFKLMEENDNEDPKELKQEASAEEPKEVFAQSESDFEETTVSFVSKSTREPNYLATIVLQKPEGKVYCVSAYVMETYLGRYAFRANFYFREGSRRSAKKCYDRVVRAVKELRSDILEDGLIQGMAPRILAKRLSGIEGEIEPRINKMAIYLDPENSPAKPDPANGFSTYIPTKRSVIDDLVM